MTEYRMITKHTHFGDTYLQFKSKKKSIFGKVTDTWRYVPEESPSAVLGYFLSEYNCPMSLDFTNDSYLICSFEGQEAYSSGPIGFTKKYPDIAEYFNLLQNRRKKHLEEERNKKKNGTIILL